MPIVRRRVRTLVVAGALFLGLSAPAGAQALAPPPSPAPVPRVVDLRGVHLRAGQGIAFALHPNEVPISVTARSDTPLEACPSTLDGAGPESGDTSWPTWTVTCIPFDATVQLPSTQSGLYHLAFLVRAAGARAATIPRLMITYTPIDGYFEVLPPPLVAGARSPRIAVTPTTERTVGAGATGLLDVVAVRGVRTLVTQRGHRVGTTTQPPPGGEAQAFGPVRVGIPVQVVEVNRGKRTVAVRIAVAWV